MNDFFGLFGLAIDLNVIKALGAQPLYVIVWHFFVNGGWLLFVVAFLYGSWITFVHSRVIKFAGKQSYVFLAIDIPKNNLQTPRAVENIFNALAGAHSPRAWFEEKIKGEFQLGFSLEIVSIDGFVQYIIRTPVQFRNLVEAALYSQYPECEITEVSDYTKQFDDLTFPNDEYNLWGTDLVPVASEVYPIRTYVDFKELLDNEFKDPMAALLEIMSKIGKGEQLWFQILINPADIGWHKKGDKAINKILGIKEKYKPSLLDKITDAPLNAIAKTGDALFSPFFGTTEKEKEKEEKFSMMAVPPTQKKQVEAIMKKMDKVCYNTKVRYIYVGKKEVFKKGLGVAGVMGAIKQYGTTAFNALKPDKNKTQARIVFIDRRVAKKQNAILYYYKYRSMDSTGGSYLMNVEEIASLFHFPYIEYKASMVKKIESRRSVAPIGLPVTEDVKGEAPAKKASSEKENVVPVVDYDNDYFEERFAIDKTGKNDKERKQKILGDLKKAKNAPETGKMETQKEYLQEDRFSVEKPRSAPTKKETWPNDLPFIE